MHISDRVQKLLARLGRKQVAVAQLEAVGLPLRIINLLEESLGVVWLEELLVHTPDELMERVPNLGKKSVQTILRSVQRLDELAAGPNQDRKTSVRAREGEHRGVTQSFEIR